MSTNKVKRERTQKAHYRQSVQQAELSQKMSKNHANSKHLNANWTNYISKLIQTNTKSSSQQGRRRRLCEVLPHILVHSRAKLTIWRCKCILWYKYECYCHWYMANSLRSNFDSSSNFVANEQIHRKTRVLFILARQIICIKLLGNTEYVKIHRSLCLSQFCSQSMSVYLTGCYWSIGPKT